MSNNPMSDNEKADSARIQAKIDVKDNPEFARRFRAAQAYGRQPTANALLKVMVEDFLKAFETGKAIVPFEPPEPPPKPKSGSQISFKPGAAVKGQGRSS